MQHKNDATLLACHTQPLSVAAVVAQPSAPDIGEEHEEQCLGPIGHNGVRGQGDDDISGPGSSLGGSNKKRLRQSNIIDMFKKKSR